MPLVAPGYAFTSEFERQLLTDQESARRDAEMRLQQQREQRMAAAQAEELRQGQEALAIRRDEANRTIRDDLRTQTVNDVKMLRMGDIPDPELVERAKRFHVPLRLAPMGSVLEQAPPPSLAAPGQEQLPHPLSGAGTPGIYTPGSVMGTPEEERKATTDRRRGELAQRLAGVKPGSPEERQILIDAAINEGHMPTAAELQTGPKDTAAEQKAQYIAFWTKKFVAQGMDPEAAKAAAYEKATTLGPAASAGAAATRQSTGENFQMKKDGLDSIKKLELDYRKGNTKAQSIIDVVNAAKRGNQEAGSVQAMLGAMGVAGVEGLNRVNMPEIATVSKAGSLLERVRSEAARLGKGNMLSSKLQNDLIELAKVMQQTQRKAYEKEFGRLKTLYQLGDEVQPDEDESFDMAETNEERRARLLREHKGQK